MSREKKIETLKEEIKSIKRQWPAHSVSPALLQKLEDLEAELEFEIKNLEEERENAKKDGCG
ncbi:MAG: histidine kinase [Anaerolineales bacterium]|jgi:molecular chaperone GrpE (heat shock protein)